MRRERFLRIRKRLGFSQRQMAEALRVHPMTVSAWERGRQPIPGPAEALMELLDRLRKEGREQT